MVELTGSIISWLNDRKRTAGHGTILGRLGEHHVLVKTHRHEPDDDEPSIMLVIPLLAEGVQLYDDEAEWRVWMQWLDKVTDDKVGEAEVSVDPLRYSPELQAVIATDWFQRAYDLAAQASALLRANGVQNATVAIPGGRLVIDG